MRILIKDDPEIARAAAELDKFTQDDEMVSVHEAREKYLHDEATRLEDSMMEGRIRGLAEGRKAGREEGRAEGRAEGRTEGRVEVAKRMLERGMSVEDVRDLTGMSEVEIREL